MRLRVTSAAAVLLTALALAGCGGDEREPAPKPPAHVLEAVYDGKTPEGLHTDSPVRVAGVEVGKVGRVEMTGGQTTFELRITEARAWPQHDGATVRIRPRIFGKPGEFFVDLVPGPGPEPLRSGDRIPAL